MNFYCITNIHYSVTTNDYCITIKGDKQLAKILGRPPIENPKRNEMRIRMTDDDLMKLDYCCKAIKKSRSEVVRLLIDKVYQEAVKNQS